MRKLVFILSNIISIILEYLIIYLFFRACNIQFIYVIITVLSIFILHLILVIFSLIALNMKTPEDERRPHQKELNEIIDMVNSKYKTKFKLFYTSSPQPNPAWCMGRCIYINNNYEINEVFSKGVVAHELGHGLSGISRYSSLASFKPSTVISKIIYLIMVKLFDKKNKFMHFLLVLLLIIYVIFSLNNLIFVYPFVRKDEYIANDFAVKLGYGNELRCYYSFGLNNNSDRMLRLTDFMHPTIDNMINRLNKRLNIKEYKNLYWVNNNLYHAIIDTITVTLPPFITTIENYSFESNTLKKIKGDGVIKVYPNSFYGLNKLEVLIISNIKTLPIGSVRTLKSLKKIVVNDETIREELKRSLEPTVSIKTGGNKNAR